MSKIYDALFEVFEEYCDKEELPRAEEIEAKVEALHWALNVCSLLTHDTYFLDQINHFRAKAGFSGKNDAL